MYSVTLNIGQISEFQKYISKNGGVDTTMNYEFVDGKFVPGIGEYHFGEFTVTCKEEGDPSGDPPRYFRRMMVTHPNDKKKLEELMNEVFVKEQEKQTIKVNTCGRHGFWDSRVNVLAQDVEYIFIPKEIKTQILDIIDQFIANKDKYTKFGRAYKTGFLFTGVPGSGKTSLVKSIALKYKRPIYMISFSRILTEEKLFDLINCIYSDSILLIEDIDSFFVERKPEETTCISFSALINILDGVLSNGNGIITFMTANNPKLLDKALIRPGRVDKIIHFDYPKKKEIKEAFMHLTDGKNFDEFYEHIRDKQINMSGIIDYLFKNETEYVKNIEQLLEQTKLYNEIVSNGETKMYL